MESNPPQVAVIDVALSGLFAFEVVEKVRNRPGLQDVKIILLSSVYNKTAYKRTPSSLYGADDYIEKHHLSDALVGKIHRLAALQPVTTQGVEASPEDADEGFIEQMNSTIQAADAEEMSQGGKGSAVEKAKRLARIIVSDIALYNQERVDEGIRCGTFYEVLAKEVEEGRRLFMDRIAPDLYRQEDYLQVAFDAFTQRRRRELEP
jgi:response regulator RpfG family c-di-GMP phosphodiesterase